MGKSKDQASQHAAEQNEQKGELQQNLSMISILGLSFAIMAVPFGLSTTLFYSLTNGQSVTVLYGWILVSFISLAIAASLAEICAVFPTAGGVYYWSAMLSTKEYAPLASYVTGTLTLIGNWTVTTSINFSGAQLILSAITLWNEDFAANAWQTVLCFWAVMAISLSVNIFLKKHLDLLNKICIVWTASSVLIIVITLLATCKHRRDAKFVFTHYDASASGWPSGWSFFVGLLSAAYTLTGYGMVASLCEEVANPAREVPKAMVLSVMAAGLTGVVFLIPILFVMPDVAMLLSVANGQPIGLLFKTVVGSAGGGFGLLFLIIGILFFAGTGALTAASRCTYAFFRDIPGSGPLGKIQRDIPLYSLFFCTGICMLLGCVYFGSSAAFNAFTGVATICLSTSYSLPIFISLIRGRRAIAHSTFSLGKLGYATNVITVVWIIFSIVLFCMPTTANVTPSTMNYTSVVFVGFTGISAIYWFVKGRKTFQGPPVDADEDMVVHGKHAHGSDVSSRSSGNKV